MNFLMHLSPTIRHYGYGVILLGFLGLGIGIWQTKKALREDKQHRQGGMEQ
jgi:hypothetical protein